MGPHRAWSDAFEEAESSSGNWPLYAGDSKGRNGGAQLSIAAQLASLCLGCILIDNKLTLLSSAGASATEKQPYINYAKTCLEGPIALPNEVKSGFQPQHLLGFWVVQWEEQEERRINI